MKNKFIVCLLMLFIISCYDSHYKVIEFVPVDSTKSFSVLGYCVPAPQYAFNVKYAIVNRTIAESNFDYNNMNYTYRASKHLEELLYFYDVLYDYKKLVDEETDIEITIQTNNREEYIAYWNIDGIYYSLFAKDDIEELSLDLMMSKALE